MLFCKGIKKNKPLDLSRSNSKKKILVNANILIRISLIIPHLLYFIFISKSKKSVIFDSLSLSTFLSLSLTLIKENELYAVYNLSIIAK